MAITAGDIEVARDAIADIARLTPLWPSKALGEAAGVPVWLKCEQMQLTGSFKLRGALHFVTALDPAERKRGVVAASAGNHAQGLAYAGGRAGVRVTVVMPTSAPLAKVAGARRYGAEVVLAGPSLESAIVAAERIVQGTGAIFVPPFDDDRIIAGQGTLGLELLSQAPDAEEILVPAGGGGLLAGVALAVKSTRPDIRIIGVQAEAMDGVRRSFLAHDVVETPHHDTIADGVAVAGPSGRTLEIIERYVDDVVACSEEAIAGAIVLLIERSKMVVEGAGALAAAALQSGAHRPRGPAVAVLSGGNIDINLLGTIVRHGLVEAGRYRRLTLTVADTPGHLARIAGAIGDAGGNIIDVDHRREAPHIPIGSVALDILIEVHGPEHFHSILDGIRAMAGVRLSDEIV